MSVNEPPIQPISQANLPRFADLSAQFLAAQQDPEAQPLGMFQRLKMFAKRIGTRISDRILGLSTESEYNTGRVYIPSAHGERFQTRHVKDGKEVSVTTTSQVMYQSGKGLRLHEVQSTKPLVPGGNRHLLSRHTHMDTTGKQVQVLTEGVTLPNGVSYARTQDFKTGETVFRKNDKGLFWTWTFDKKKQLISAYEGSFGNPGQPDQMNQTDYEYNEKGKLISATETRNTITPEGENIRVISHPITSRRENSHTPFPGGRE